RSRTGTVPPSWPLCPSEPGRPSRPTSQAVRVRPIRITCRPAASSAYDDPGVFSTGPKSMQTTRPMQNPKAQRKLASVRLDRRLVTPLFRQVYQRIREAILDGTLPPGASLPSTRSLAGQLSTARGTIELAYALLVGEGYVVGRAAAGTVVNPGLSQLSMLARGQTLGGKHTSPGVDLRRVQPARP